MNVRVRQQLTSAMFESTIVNAKVYKDETGVVLEVPVLLSSYGPLLLLIDYLVLLWQDKSPSLMRKVANALKLFLEYFVLHAAHYKEKAIFENFRTTLIAGTISNGTDPTGLFWSARRTYEADKIIGMLTDFFNWWASENPGKENPALSWVGSKYDLRVAEAAYQYRRNQAFLGHTWSSTKEASKSGKSYKARPSPKAEVAQPNAFPEERILDLILKGFKVGRRYSYRDMLLVLLMNGAGFRASEPFHLYVSDVMEDPFHPGQALVLIHHPSEGDAPRDPMWVDASGRPRRGNRTAYLAERFGIAPRNWGLSSTAAGWKGGMHETTFGGLYKQAYWFVPEFGEMFWEFWNIYMEQVACIPRHLRAHPYAFMNIAREPRGEIYKLGKLSNSHAAAVRRIGLEPSQELGTHEHGHRHAYGQRLRKAGVSEEMIRRFMHHTDISSQKVYTAPTREECAKEIADGLSRLNGATSQLRTQIIEPNLREILRYS